MCVCVHAHAHVHMGCINVHEGVYLYECSDSSMCICMHVEAKGLYRGGFFNHSPPYVLRQDFSLSVELICS